MWQSSMTIPSRFYLPMLALTLALTAGNAGADQFTQERATPVADGTPAEIILNVPLDGIVFIDGRRTYTSGMTRRFVTPPLAPERKYYYDVKVTWIDGSRARESSRHISFRAGDRIVLNYSRPNWRETAQDLYLDPAAPAPWTNNYHDDILNAPYYPNKPFVYPGYRYYPR